MSKVVADNKLFSLSEWYQGLGHATTNEFRKEDNDKRERLDVLFFEIGLRYDKPDKFPAPVVKNRTPEFLEYLEKNKDRLCAFRLVPDDEALPKLRMRGKTVAEALPWLDEQNLDFSHYRLDIVPHTDQIKWSAIFLVKPEGIVGEIIRGGHSLLTMGNATEQSLLFQFNYQTWKFSAPDPEAEAIIKQGVSQIKVEDSKVQEKLAKELKAEFINNYIGGYWEFTVWPDNNIYFIDYNRLLHKMIDINNFLLIGSNELDLHGALGYPGQAQGKVVKVKEEEITTKDFPTGSILVCECTIPEYLPLMKKAAAIITDQGGILSHAAIVARELKVPCLVGTKNATKVLQDGDEIEINSSKNLIRRIN